MAHSPWLYVLLQNKKDGSKYGHGEGKEKNVTRILDL